MDSFCTRKGAYNWDIEKRLASKLVCLREATYMLGNFSLFEYKLYISEKKDSEEEER